MARHERLGQVPADDASVVSGDKVDSAGAGAGVASDAGLAQATQDLAQVGGVIAANRAGMVVCNTKLDDASVVESGGAASSPLTPRTDGASAVGQGTGNRPFAVEFCAGSARLTAELIRVGFDAIGVDWAGNKDTPVAPVVSIDLTSAQGQAEADELLLSPLLAFAHFAPPCGTASRAREKRIPGLPGGGPKPLRSPVHPRGLPDLDSRMPHAGRRVRAANAIYDWIARAAASLTKRGIPWTLENPHDSLFWYLITVIGLLVEQVGDVFFHNCMHGGTRDKRTRLRCFPAQAFAALGINCDNSHEHAPWGVHPETGQFATAGERVYPVLLCERLAAAAWAAHESRVLPVARSPPAPSQGAQAGCVGERVTRSSPAASRALMATRASAAVQPRGNRFPHVVPMFKGVVRRLILREDVGKLTQCIGKTLHSPVKAGPITFEEGCQILQVESLGSPGPGHVKESLGLAPPTRATLKDWQDANPSGVNFVYIGRGGGLVNGQVLTRSRWANPFRVKEFGRSRCIQMFGDHLRSLSDYPQCLLSLVGARLICHCEPDQECHGDVIISECEKWFNPARVALVDVSIPWSTSEFVEKALDITHPFSDITCDPSVWRAAFLLATRGPVAFGDLRLRELAKWRVRSRELEKDEAALHRSLHPDVVGSVGRKKLLLLREMLREACFPGAEAVFESMVSGFTVLGPVPATGVFPEDGGKTATLREADLRREAPLARAALAGSKPPQEDEDLVQAVFDETLREIELGWMRGPFTAEELDSKFEWWLPARRFGIRQGAKVRAVDDYSIYGHNECTSTREKIDVGGIDNTLAITRCLMQVLGGSGDEIVAAIPGHERMCGHRARDLPVCELVGKMWDLSKAYRQLPRNPMQAHLSIVAVFDPTRRCWKYFEQLALPFGATAAVYHFNLVARGLQFILNRLFAVFCCHFFDDFPVVELKSTAVNAQFIVDQVFLLLGWDTKEQVPFATKFEPLGVVVDLSGSSDGRVVVTNKEARLEELREFVNRVTGTGSMTVQEVRRFRGRFVFSRAQVFGRVGAPALRALGSVADARTCHDVRTQKMAGVLARLLDILVVTPPRAIQARLGPPVILFVDGACDPGDSLPRVGVGACLFDKVDGTVVYFGTPVDDVIVSLWASRPEQQVIAQAELVPTLMALSTWADRVRGRPLVVFIDNDSARFGLISGYSAVPASAAIISLAWGLIARLGVFPWFARVPTVCNPADGPSRGRMAAMENFTGSRRVQPSFQGASGGAMWRGLAQFLVVESQ